MSAAATMAARVARFLSRCDGNCAALADIYRACAGESRSKTPEASVRRAIYEHGDAFRSIARGVWMYAGERSTSLLIEGDGRTLSAVESASIDCIITDHPWDSKSNRGGNRSFADYEVFNYRQPDFDAKARVLKDGAYLVEFLPVETGANWRYLAQVKEMARAAGLELYASLIWRKRHGGCNTGRTTKGVEQIIIFSKGAPRRLSGKGKPYMTRTMLEYEVDMPQPLAGRVHPAEKPVELYAYLIENLTEEREVVLDQFGGACNLVEACERTGRFGVVFETCAEYMRAAVERFGAVALEAAQVAEGSRDTVPEPIGGQLALAI